MCLFVCLILRGELPFFTMFVFRLINCALLFWMFHLFLHILLKKNRPHIPVFNDHFIEKWYRNFFLIWAIKTISIVHNPHFIHLLIFIDRARNVKKYIHFKIYERVRKTKQHLTKIGAFTYLIFSNKGWYFFLYSRPYNPAVPYLSLF